MELINGFRVQEFIPKNPTLDTGIHMHLYGIIKNFSVKTVKVGCKHCVSILTGLQNHRYLISEVTP